MTVSNDTHDQPPVPRLAVIIPAFNEESAIGLVLADIPTSLQAAVIVVDNGSTDSTAQRAREGGANVLTEPIRGYGRACLTGLAALEDDVEIVVFLDGDYSDHPDEMERLVRPIIVGEADLVIGSRVLGNRESGALLPQARLGNALATWLIKRLFGVSYTDLGPFRAVRRRALDGLQMCDLDFGWTVEMQVKAARQGLRVAEVPVSYRKRTGTSKITGTVRGTVRAGHKILWTIFRYGLRRR